METEIIETVSVQTQGDILERVFRSSIKNEKPVDAKLMLIAKTLASQYMDHYRPGNAVEIINLLLSRVWPSFLSAPITGVEMTTTFPKETVELILEFMVPAYTQQRQPEKVERTLATLFNAALTAKSVDLTLVNKVQALLIEHTTTSTIIQKNLSQRCRKHCPSVAQTLAPLTMTLSRHCMI